MVNSLLEGSEIKTLLSLVEECSQNGMTVVEVGVHTGGTSIILSKHVETYDGVLYCIDSWPDDETFRVFKEVAEPLGIRFYRLPSIEASRLFPDSSLDLVFIDADHRYNAVHEDILAWLPKVRLGGILCGHDCERKYTSYGENEQRDIDQNIEEDKTHFACHAGVVKALYDIFKDDYFVEPRIWWVKKAVT